MQLTSGKLDRFGRFSRAALFAASVLPVTFAALPASAADYPQSAPAVVDNTVCNQQSVLRSVVSRFGYQVRQLDELLKAHDLVTRLVIVEEANSEEEIRDELVQNLKRVGDYVIVTYKRETVGQRGGGHISPLGAYDAASDSFLVLDVNPASAGWVWMPTPTLVKGMRTFDTVENRGYILVQPG